MWLTYNATTLPTDLGQILHQVQVWAKLVDHDIPHIMHSTCLRNNPDKMNKKVIFMMSKRMITNACGNQSARDIKEVCSVNVNARS
jgi:hypothetical protein